MSDRSNSFFRYLAYTIELVICFILQTTPRLLPDIYGAKPVLLLCVALTVAVYERELPAMFVGMAAGILADLSSSGSIGFFTIVLTVVCFGIGYAANNLIVATFLNFLLYSLISVGIIFMLYFSVNFLITGVEDVWEYFTSHFISRMVQTFLLSIPFYFFNKMIYSLLEPNVS